MWNALGKMTGAVSGVFYSSEQPPFDCAWPLKDVGDMRNCGQMSEEQHDQITQLHNDPEWYLVENYVDPDGGDLRLFTRPAIGNYFFLKSTFTLAGVTAQQFLNVVGNSRLEVRQKFSVDCIALKKLDEPTAMTELLYAQYYAPPPVAGRDFCFLVGRRENSDGSYEIWGCSVASDLAPEGNTMTNVRGASLWGWKLIPAGEHLLVQYANCFDPRGWTPGFILQWLKTTAAKEFCAIRAVLLGKEVHLDKETDLSSIGVSAEQANAEATEHQKAAK
jgi:hypothetical protein